MFVLLEKETNQSTHTCNTKELLCFFFNETEDKVTFFEIEKNREEKESLCRAVLTRALHPDPVRDESRERTSR